MSGERVIKWGDNSYTLPFSAIDIQSILPHRYPFIMIDQVTEFVDLDYIQGVKLVSANEPFFNGHFPNRPIMPGVLILEALAQIGAIFAKLATGGATPDKLIVFSGATDVRFRRPVVPGDILTLRMGEHRKRGQHWRMVGSAKVGDAMAAEAIIMATEI